MGSLMTRDRLRKNYIPQNFLPSFQWGFAPFELPFLRTCEIGSFFQGRAVVKGWPVNFRQLRCPIIFLNPITDDETNRFNRYNIRFVEPHQTFKMVILVGRDS